MAAHSWPPASTRSETDAGICNAGTQLDEFSRETSAHIAFIRNLKPRSMLEERRPGRYQVEAAIAALHDDAASAEETDWPQILAWYDDLVALSEDPLRQDPAAVLGRAVAVGHVLDAAAGLRETDRLREVIGERHRWHAVRGHLHELDGDLPAERDHLVRQAARARAAARN